MLVCISYPLLTACFHWKRCSKYPFTTARTNKNTFKPPASSVFGKGADTAIADPMLSVVNIALG